MASEDVARIAGPACKCFAANTTSGEACARSSSRPMSDRAASVLQRKRAMEFGRRRSDASAYGVVSRNKLATEIGDGRQ